MLNPINWAAQKLIDIEYKPKEYYPLSTELETLFDEHGEGLYLVNFAYMGGNWISKTISNYSNGLVHTVIAAVSKDWTMFSPKQKANINKNLHKFYKTKISLSQIKALVLSSANPNGIHCCDFSFYNNAKMTIRKLPINADQKKIIADFLESKIGTPYDMTGLFGFLIRLGDTDANYWCSEIDYEACKKAGLRIAHRDNPSPGDIESFDVSPKIFDNRQK